MNRRFMLALALVLAGAVLLAACGSFQPPGPPQRAVEQVVAPDLPVQPVDPPPSGPACFAAALDPSDAQPWVVVPTGADMLVVLHCVGVPDPPEAVVVNGINGEARVTWTLNRGELIYEGSTVWGLFVQAAIPGDWILEYELAGRTVARIPLRVVDGPEPPAG